MKSAQRLARQMETRQVIIREVNVSQRFLQAEDSYGSKLLLKFNEHGPVVVVPQSGEVWNVKRQGTDWSLDKRVEATQLYTDLLDLNPGDKRLEALETLRLEGKSIAVTGNITVAGDLSVTGSGPLKVACGYVTATEVGTLTVTGVGFKPKIVHFTLVPFSETLALAATGSADLNGTHFWTASRVSATGQYSTADGATCIGWLSADTIATISNRGSLVSMDSDGFTLDITTDTFATFFFEAKG